LSRCVAGLGAMLATLVGGVTWASPARGVEPVRPAQWYLDSWKIDEAWAISQGQGVTVALVDSGVDTSHPDLVGQIDEGTYAGAGTAVGSHGTSMASLIVGTGKGVGGQGAFGVAPKARILAFNVPDRGDGAATGDNMDAAKVTTAIRAAADSPAKIINLSLDGPYTKPRADALAYALSKGKLVVASGGNVSETVARPPYPAAYPGVLAVGGYDRSGTLWSGSLTGNWVSLAGPGAEIVAACTGSTGYCKSNGTSDAAALTSGVAALLWSQRPDYTANQIIKVLIDSANKPAEGPVPNDLLGYGNVSPRKALGWTGDPGPKDVNPLVGKRGDLPSPSATPPAGQAAPSQSAAAPGGAQPGPESSAAVAGSAAEKSDSGGSNTLVVVAVIGGGVIALAVIVGLFVRSRRNRGGPGGPGGPPPPMPNSAPPYGASQPNIPPPPGPYRR
jgi:type VII secretion-associated serine protease mycosin